MESWPAFYMLKMIQDPPPELIWPPTGHDRLAAGVSSITYMAGKGDFVRLVYGCGNVCCREP